MQRGDVISYHHLRQAYAHGRFSGEYLLLMALSGILAALAFLADSIPLLLGAMIVAPAFRPLALTVAAVCAGMWRYALRGFLTACAGLAVATLMAVVTLWAVYHLGLLDSKTALLSRPLLEERVRPGWYSVMAAAAAGIAGTLGFLRDKTDTLIGTVASVALVPAAAAAAGALYAGDPVRAVGGVVLLLGNVALILAMGIITIAIRRPVDEPAAPAQTSASR